MIDLRSVDLGRVGVSSPGFDGRAVEIDWADMATVFLEYGVDFWAVGALPLGVGLDLALGGFRWVPDPSRAIGRLVELTEGGLRVAVARRGGGSRVELVAGSVLALVVVGLVGGLAWLAVELLNLVGGPVTLIGRAILIGWGLSLRRLGDQALRASEAPDLATARRAAAPFAGLDSTRLDRSGINRSCVEGLGERANSMVIAPLFWLAIAGPGGLWCYKAIDTLRGLVVNGMARYRYFGFTTARLDDLANFLPARLTWLLIALSAALLGHDGASALRVGWAQGRHHPDRQGIWGKAALAAAFGVGQDGRVVPGPTDSKTVRRAVRVTQVASLHASALALAYRIVVLGD